MQSITLTDVSADIWLPSFNSHFGSAWVKKRALRGGLRDGIDLIEISNGKLSFSVLPTRGMSLWRGRYGEIELGWKAPILGPVHPKFVNLCERGGLGWLTGFDEWLCRCGLNWLGPPGDDDGRMLTLHGRIANSLAHYVQVAWDDNGIQVVGEVEEAGLFHSRLRLRTTYSTALDSSRLTIHDEVTNVGGMPSEFQILYHINNGPPLLRAGSRIVAPVAQLWPINERAADGVETWNQFGPPEPGFAEKVYCAFPAADADGAALAGLIDANSTQGIALQWNVNDLPCFTMWKNTAAIEDGYVVGLEPATSFPRFRTIERAAGRVLQLQPGERWSATWSMEILPDQASVADFVSTVNDVQSRHVPMIHTTPLP